MPSGSKKRKAAKKKKETGTPNNPGNDEMKSQDSDGEEFSTPADSHQTPFEAGEFRTPAVDFHQTPFQVGGEELEKTGSSSVGSFSKSTESHRRVVSESERFVEAVPDLESPGHIQSSKGHHDKDDTNSRSSSSDDEKQGTGEAPSFGDMMSKEVGKLKDIATVGGNALVSDVVKPVVSVSMGLARVKEYAPIGTSAASEVLKENGEKLMAKFGELTRTSPTAMDSESNKKGEESSNTVTFAPEDSEGKAVSSSPAPSNETGNGGGHTKNSKTPQNPETEPLLPVAPRPVRTTSWKSCCGLCEWLTGSNR